MKIATWNVERFKHIRQLDEILLACRNSRADILVLTETDTRIVLPYRNCLFSSPLSDNDPVYYKATERRIAIYTNYNIVGTHSTYDDKTALCVELETERGRLSVYGTIIGIQGNRRASFIEDLNMQTDDLKRITTNIDAICFCGDYNCSFADNYYFTKLGRETLLSSFAENDLVLLTAAQSQCIDHITISSCFCSDTEPVIEEWNIDKRLSDHKGVAVSL